ncbi:hypothetical protein [Pseudoponticoccus marisrubri]|uniref:Uncharacterized protein n=1 Tax=Pseudoponticoccus marisrubri TaxID=1685382 RepID=A0A0W7WM13_9RHOB|nr:hypothetical protein [Pseudoponticoccus marisrubri]KUF11599.1 hypothetical protein AVJ23_07535 [Pseudoponticoccus marisrubri]
MTTAYRKLSRADFRQRVRRVDPGYHYLGQTGRPPQKKRQRPLVACLLGFGWAYLVISVGANRAFIESSLQAGSLPAEYHGAIFGGLAMLMAASGVMLLIHLFRFVARTGGRRANSGGLLAGALGAAVLVYTPPGVWSAGYQMLDGNSRSLLQTASSTLPDLDLGQVSLVSSFSR